MIPSLHRLSLANIGVQLGPGVFPKPNPRDEVDEILKHVQRQRSIEIEVQLRYYSEAGLILRTTANNRPIPTTTYITDHLFGIVNKAPSRLDDNVSSEYQTVEYDDERTENVIVLNTHQDSLIKQEVINQEIDKFLGIESEEFQYTETKFFSSNLPDYQSRREGLANRVTKALENLSKHLEEKKNAHELSKKMVDSEAIQTTPEEKTQLTVYIQGVKFKTKHPFDLVQRQSMPDGDFCLSTLSFMLYVGKPSEATLCEIFGILMYGRQK